MALNLQIVPKGFEEAEKILTAAGKSYPKAAKDAILTGLKHGRTIADKEIRGRYAIKKSDVMPKLSVEMPTNFDGTLESKGSMLPVSLFKPTQVKKGVKVTILKGKRGLIESAFIRKGRVWQRRSPKQYPIKIVSTAGVPLMTSVKAVSEKIQEAIQKKTSERMASNVARALAGKAFG